MHSIFIYAMVISQKMMANVSWTEPSRRKNTPILSLSKHGRGKALPDFYILVTYKLCTKYLSKILP